MARAKTPGNGNTRRKPAAETTLATNPFESSKNPTPVDLEIEIRQRAYELYTKRGYVPGHENEDWLVAEQEVLAKRGVLARAHHA
jgi:hypothetical protein